MERDEAARRREEGVQAIGGDGAGGVPGAGLPAEANSVGGGGGGVEVGGWSGFGGQPQGVGQLHDFEVALGWGAGGGRIEGGEADGETGQEGEKLGLGFEGDGAGDGGERRQEAGELDGVAEAVVAADEDFAVFVGAAVPDPAQVIGQRGVVAACLVPALLDVVGNLPGRFMVAGARCRHPFLI